eukprot:CAMPEP_0194581686 /NCGR_PEP_ID=MMETSP0292-20121207/15081_1 /TAXON_ID=39354 /ORGANISM="Heterosigma akashiwo, Strain CCMP2393" /LENGTH=142 /DNA_ID=CAMNT_0039435543 /DNA_START=103 /DNA_END=534 /DNA_ORIENTATION=+
MAQQWKWNPQRAHVFRDDKLAQFLSPSSASITGALDEVPGVSQLAKRKLAEAEDNIQTTHQLLGKFLSFKGKETDCIEHLEEFNHWLETIGISRYGRVGIVRSIAEKVNIMMPEIYEGSLHHYLESVFGKKREGSHAVFGKK